MEDRLVKDYQQREMERNEDQERQKKMDLGNRACESLEQHRKMCEAEDKGRQIFKC